MNVIAWILALSSFFLIILFLGYPAVVFLFSKLLSRHSRKRNITPTITLIIPCYNENHVIRHKIKNTLLLDYPRHGLEIIAIDSGSTDGTTETLRAICRQRSVKLIAELQRSGKAQAINRGLQKARGEIVILTDADAFLKKDAIKNLVRNFADPTVGAVVGKYKMQGKSLISRAISFLFSLFKDKVRHYESELDSASYFTGELLAFRRQLVESIDPEVIADDQFILLEVRRKGYRCLTEPASEVTECIVDSLRDHIRHRRRTTYGTLQVTSKFKSMLFNPGYGIFGCFIYPMYLIRILFFPIMCLLLEVSFLLLILTLVLEMTRGVFLILSVGLGMLFLTTTLFLKRGSVLKSLSCVFVLQIAVALGIIDFLTGKRKQCLWPKLSKTRTNRM